MLQELVLGERIGKRGGQIATLFRTHCSVYSAGSSIKRCRVVDAARYGASAVTWMYILRNACREPGVVAQL